MMKKQFTIYTITLILLFSGCSDSPKGVVENYFKAIENQNFEELQNIGSNNFKDRNNEKVYDCIKNSISNHQAKKEFVSEIDSALKDGLKKHNNISFEAYNAKNEIIRKIIYKEIGDNKYSITSDCKLSIFNTTLVDYKILDIKLNEHENEATAIIKVFFDNNKEKYDLRWSIRLIKDIEYGWQVDYAGRAWD
jgi:hypothetical protein